MVKKTINSDLSFGLENSKFKSIIALLAKDRHILDFNPLSNKIYMEYRKIKNPGSLKELALATFYYISGSILGPLLFFLGLGYLLDNIFKTKPKMLIVGFFVAFVVTNILLFKKVSALNREIDTYKKPEDNKENK